MSNATPDSQPPVASPTPERGLGLPTWLENFYDNSAKFIRAAEIPNFLALMALAVTAPTNTVLVVFALLAALFIGIVTILGFFSKSPTIITTLSLLLSLFIISVGFQTFRQNVSTAPADPTAVSSIPEKEPLATNRPLGSMSNKQLLAATIAHADKMRQFEITWREYEPDPFNPLLSNEQKQQKYREENQRREDNQNAKDLMWKNSFYFTSIKLPDEIINRLTKVGIMPPYFPNDTSLRFEIG